MSIRAAQVTATFLVLLTLAGCGRREVHGSVRSLRLSENGQEQFGEISLAGEGYAAHQLQDDGTFESYPGFTFLDFPSVFIIDDVPDGEYVLRRDIGGTFMMFFNSSADDIDLSTANLGRLDVTRAVAPTPLRFNLSGLSAWNPSDQLELVSANVGLFADLRFVASSTPAPGEETLFATVDFSEQVFPMIVSARGDVVTLAQVERVDVPIGAANVLTRFYRAEAFTMAETATSTLSGSFVEVARDRSVTLDVQGSAFVAERTRVHPDALMYGVYVSFQSLFAAKKHGAHSPAPNLATFDGPSEAGDFTVPLEFGDPYPENWDDIVVSDYEYGVAVRAPGVTWTATVPARLRSITTYEDFVAGGARVTPKLGPVLNPRVEGLDAHMPARSVGTIPHITWDPPAFGTPTAYTVTIFELVPFEGFTALDAVAEFHTRVPEIRFPLPMLYAEAGYIARITAIADPAIDLDRAPFREKIPRSSSDVITSIFVP